jgi:biopolymer transport protein TolR
MMVNGKNSSLMSDINVTPFVDVMLVLLIIFMVTAPMMVQGVDVALPEVRHSDSLPSEEDQLIISIDKEGKIRINEAEVGIDLLQEKLTKIFETRMSKDVFLKADKGVPYGKVVEAMSEIKGAGVEKLGMVTQPAEQEKNPKKKGS